MRSVVMRLQKMPIEERLFAWMLLAAMCAHILVLLMFHIFPKSPVRDARMRVMEFRIGDTQISAPLTKTELPVAKTKTFSAPKAIQKVPTPAVTPKPVIKMRNVTEKRVRVQASPAVQTELPRRAPAENPSASLASQHAQEHQEFSLPTLDDLFGQVEQESAQNDASVDALTQVASDNTAATPQGEAVRARYEQEISGWVAQQRFYPSQGGGRNGRTVVRVRIDRSGYVRYYGVEETSGYEVFDRAAIDMIRKANPMPKPPTAYPAGNLIEFLIPITFKP